MSRSAALLASATMAIVLGLAMSQGTAQQRAEDLAWPFYGNNPGGMRYQDIDQINPGNVSELKPVWILHTKVIGKHTSFEDQPIIRDGMMFITSPRDHVFAVDPATGQIIWTYSPTDMPPLSDIAACCGQDNRGVAVSDGKVFVGRLDGTLVALNERTGQPAWKVTVADWRDKWSETMAPLAIDGKVIIGGSGGEFLRRGFVAAYDANTGRQIWRFYTVPRPDEFGGDTWAGDSWRTGGGTVWTTPMADPRLGLLYITTGNAAPDLNGSRRAGDNLFTDSVVALDISSGQMRWYFQEVHHDLWDYDAAQPVQLFTLDRHGKRIPALGHANKDGYYFILDRRTGHAIAPVYEEPVPTHPVWQHPSPTQPVPVTARLIPDQVEHVPQQMHAAAEWTPPQPDPTLIQPGFEAGPEWTPSAYSPRTHFTYIEAGGYQPWNYRAIPDEVNTLASAAVPKIPGVRNWGLIEAIDTTTGRIVWRDRTPHKLVSGVTVAGDLVFVGQSDRRFDALDARTGKVLWSFYNRAQGIGGANGCPAVYTVNGREYIVMAFGGNDHVRLSDMSPVGDAVIAFALGQNGPPRIIDAHPQPVPTGSIPASNMISPEHTPPSGARVIDVLTHDYNFWPTTISAHPGEKIAFHLVNEGIAPASMAVMLPSGPLALKGKVKPHKDAYFVFTAPTHPGTYRTFSPLPNQKFFGMVGILRVGNFATAGSDQR